MTATRNLPDSYILRWDFNLKRDWRTGLLMQAAGLGLFILFGAGFGALIQSMRDDLDLQQAIIIAGALDGLALIGALLGIMALVVVLHEWVHGLFFWAFTHERPKFGVGWGYAYACAPGWYFPRGQYLVVGLAPLILLSLAGLAVIAVAPPGWVGALFWGLLINASGAVGDLWVTARIALERGDVLVEDTGDGFRVYGNG
jgi:hypothetical protein